MIFTSCDVCLWLIFVWVCVFSCQCKPVEEYYRAQDKVLDFDVLGGIPETWPKLLEAVKPYLPKAALAVAAA
jgi:hypothetical protein